MAPDSFFPGGRAAAARMFGAGLAAALAVGLTGCDAQPTRREAGMVIGGVLGGVIGQSMGRGDGQTAATIVGTLIGAAIGGEVGRAMDDSDRLKTAHALETVRTGVPSQWINPDTGHRYTMVPTRTTEAAGGPCREYTIDATIGGRIERVVGSACRQPDGSWRTMP